MSRSHRRPRYAGGLRHVTTTAVLVAIHLSAGVRLDAQDLPPDTAAATVPAPDVPIFLSVGLGYGQRVDRCAYCASAKNTRSFTGHVGIGKYVAALGAQHARGPRETEARTGQKSLDSSLVR